MGKKHDKYNEKMKAQGLEKVTMWLPSKVTDDFKLAAARCVENRDATVNSLRSISTGVYISLNK